MSFPPLIRVSPTGEQNLSVSGTESLLDGIEAQSPVAIQRGWDLLAWASMEVYSSNAPFFHRLSRELGCKFIPPQTRQAMRPADYAKLRRPVKRSRED